MADPKDPKSILRHYLQQSREALLWKVEGLSERDLRLPRTPTGTNLLGLVKHMANVEIGYFGDTFGRVWTGDRVSEEEYAADQRADLFATEDETSESVLGLYREVWTFADATLEELSLDSLGRVPWWPVDRNQVTLERVTVHVLVNLARHAGHADILREALDASAGLHAEVSNLPDLDWTGYVAKLNAIASRF